MVAFAMTLEERSMAALRRKLLDSNAMILNDVWSKTDAYIKGGNEFVEFETSIRRDVLAYAVLQAIDTHSGYAFGGFVRGHFSGKPWKDLDIVIPNSLSILHVWRHIIRFITFVLPISMKDVRYTVHTKSYASCRTLTVRKGDRSVTIEIDIVRQAVLDRTTRTGHMYRPVTIGSCLVLREGEAQLRKNIDACVECWNIGEVVTLLANGEDVKLCFKLNSMEYAVFYWSRIQRMENMGWSLLEACNCKEPVRPADDQLML